MNRDNLLKLAHYLEGPLMAAFNMKMYSDLDSDGHTTCGSVGCAVGHAPFVGIKKFTSEDWFEYGLRVFEVNTYEYAFLFGGGWSVSHNNPHETARRIRYFLNEGVPRGWSVDYGWTTPPVVETPKERTVYRTVVIDTTVKELTEKERCAQ